MTALAYRLEPGCGWDGLSTRMLEIPRPGPHHVVVRVRAASIDRRDIMVMDGTYPLPARPGVVPLAAGVGEVIALEDGVTRAAAGDRVTGTYFVGWIDGPQTQALSSRQYGATHDGWLAEYILLEEDSIVHVPAHLTDAEAATLTYNAQVTLIGAFPAPPGRPPVDPLGGKYLAIRRVAVGSRADFQAMNQAIAEHGVRPVVDRIFPFDQAVAAFRYFAEGDPFGKVVVTVP